MKETPSDSDDFTRLVDMLAGEAEPADADRVTDWLAKHPEQQALAGTLSRIRQVFAENGERLAVDPQRAADEALAQVQRSAAAKPVSPVLSISSASATSRRSWRTAGWVGLGVIVATLLFLVGWRSDVWRVRPHRTPRMFTYTTANGKQATITLPDGSVVMLNVASRLVVPMDYDRDNRVLRLSGEALFTVAHQNGATFTVVAGRSTTRVLGTTFAVRDYPTDTAAVIAVRDGKVVVQSSVLTAAQQITVGASGIGHIQAADPTRFNFTQGMLTIDHVPLRSAIADLDRWYDVDIHIADSMLATQTVVGTFQSGSMTDVADILALAFDVRVVRDGRVLTLYPKGKHSI